MHLVAAWIQDTSAMSLNPQNHGSCQAVCPTAWKQGWISSTLNAPNMPLSSTFLLLLERIEQLPHQLHLSEQIQQWRIQDFESGVQFQFCAAMPKVAHRGV